MAKKKKEEEKKEEEKEDVEETSEEEQAGEQASEDLPEKIQNIIDSIAELTVLEVSKLVKGMEDVFGVSAQAAVAVAPGAAGAAQDGAEEAEEKTAFDVVLKDFGSAKIKVIKAVREVTSLSLKEAKNLVESAPVNVKEGIPEDEAEDVKSAIEDVGGVVEIQ